MAKLSKKAMRELDEAIDALGGGVAPVPRPKPVRRVTKPVRKAVKAKGAVKKR